MNLMLSDIINQLLYFRKQNEQKSNIIVRKQLSLSVRNALCIMMGYRQRYEETCYVL